MTSQADDAESLAIARDRYLKAQRNARYRAKTKRDAKSRPYKPKVAPPPVVVPRAEWPQEEKAQWFQRLLWHISEGGSVASFCRNHPEGPARTQFYSWLQDDASWRDSYSRAREMSADTLADDCVLIADEVKDAGQFDSARVNAARLRVDARKWVASKLKPKTYADRIETVQSGSLTVEHRLSDEDRAKVLQAIEARRLAGNANNLAEAHKLIDITPAKKDGP